METNKLAWKIGGEAGYGIMTAGGIFAKSCSRGGLYVYGYPEYPSLIRGGHNTFHLRIEDKPIHSQIDMVDILIALNAETITYHMNEMRSGGAILYDGDEIDISKMQGIRDDVKMLSVPLAKLTTNVAAQRVMRNMVAIGASFGLVDYDFDQVKNVISERFKKKGDEIVKENVDAAKAGYDYVKENYPGFDRKLEKTDMETKMILSGNQAFATGAVKAGCKFISSYPMTPATSILQGIAAASKKYDIVVKQTEDELAAISMAIGANHVGVRAMACTSGGGFALMTEALGLAGMTETPLVIVNSQRPGPSTGLPTWTGQGDLRMMLHASQDEFPRIVIAPGDAQEAFYAMHHAFNLAEKYQLQVLILSDKYLSESYNTFEKFDLSKLKIDRGKLLSDEEAESQTQDRKRFKFTDDGVSPRWVPGQKGGVYTITGNEHEETGLISEDPVNRIKMVDKRDQKLETAKADMPSPRLYGSKDADLTLVAWGSTKMPIMQALEFIENKTEMKAKVNFLHVQYIWPFSNEIEKILKASKKTMILEANKSGQFANLIRENTGLKMDYKFVKYDGRPFFPEEILNKVCEVLSK